MAPTATLARDPSPSAPLPPDGRRGAEDRAAVLAAQAGDSAAFGQLFARWGDRVHDLALRIVRDRDRAADVTQDTFEVAWRRLPSLEDPLAFGGWLLRIARNRALDHLARAGRTVPIGDAAPSRGRGLEPALADAAPASVEAAEVAALVWTASAALAPRDLSLLDLHLRHGLGAGEIAAELGVAPGAAHQMLHRLRVRLREAVRSAVLWDRGTPGCALLRAELRAEGITAFDGPAAGVIADHAERCEVCADRRRTRLSPEALFAAAPLLVLPATARLRLAGTLTGPGRPEGPGPIADTSSSEAGAPTTPGPAVDPDDRGETSHVTAARGVGRRGRRVAAAAAGAAVVAGLGVLLVLPGPGEDTPTAIAATPSSQTVGDPAGDVRDGGPRSGAAPSTAPSAAASPVPTAARDAGPTTGSSPSTAGSLPSTAAPGDDASEPSAPPADPAAPDAPAGGGALGGSDEGDAPDGPTDPGETPVPPAAPGAPSVERPPSDPPAPPAPLIVSFSATRTPRPGCATPSAAIVLTWRTSGGDVAVRGPGAPGGTPVTSGTAVACSPGPATYVVVVTGPGGVAEQAVVVA